MIKLSSRKLSKINEEVEKITSKIPSSHNRKIEKVTFSETRKLLSNIPKVDITLEKGKSYTFLISRSYNAGSSKWTDTINYFQTLKVKYIGESKCYIKGLDEDKENVVISKDKIIGIVK